MISKIYKLIPGILLITIFHVAASPIDGLTLNNSIAHDQLLAYGRSFSNKKWRVVDAQGCPVPSLTASMTVGDQGPIVIQDTTLLHRLAKFDRERIPERVVHAKGGGAFGYFEVTHDITKYTKAKVFEKIGKQTRIAMRFSTVGGNAGSADTLRDPRGFAIKFYSEDGNWDLVGNNIPIFFLRDPFKFPSFIHTQKRNPSTNLKCADMFWDFISLSPETTHQVSFLFSDRGTPYSWRNMNGYGSHTFKFVNKNGEGVYIKFHMKTNQGIKNFDSEEATKMAGENPDFCIQDLYDAIAKKKYPSWTMYIQVMTFKEAQEYKFNPFDLTKVWLHADFPLKKVGKFILNQNAMNYFAEIEQLAFAPSNLIPGIEPSPDKMLHARMHSYADTHRHRIGPNYEQLPVNQPKFFGFDHKNIYTRSGVMDIWGIKYGGAPNYFPNSWNSPFPDNSTIESEYNSCGDVYRKETGDEDNFSQARLFWERVLNSDERQRLVENIAGHLQHALPDIQKRALKNFFSVNSTYGGMIEKILMNTGVDPTMPKIEKVKVYPYHSFRGREEIVTLTRDTPCTAFKIYSEGTQSAMLIMGEKCIRLYPDRNCKETLTNPSFTYEIKEDKGRFEFKYQAMVAIRYSGCHWKSNMFNSPAMADSMYDNIDERMNDRMEDRMDYEKDTNTGKREKTEKTDEPKTTGLKNLNLFNGETIAVNIN